MRIRMPEGHNELNLEGTTYKPDVEGAFDVPKNHAEELIRVHGAIPEATTVDLDAKAAGLEAHVVSLEGQLKAARKDALDARAKADASNAKRRVALSKTAQQLADEAKAAGGAT